MSGGIFDKIDDFAFKKFRDASLKFRDASLKKGLGFFKLSLGLFFASFPPVFFDLISCSFLSTFFVSKFTIRLYSPFPFH